MKKLIGLALSTAALMLAAQGAHANDCDKGERVVKLSDTFVVLSLTALGTSEVEAEDTETESHECARQCMRHLVVHGSAMLWMRMTDDGAAPGLAVAWLVDYRLQPAGRTVDEHSLADGCCRHTVRLVLRWFAKVTPASRHASCDAVCEVYRHWLATPLLA